MARLAVSKQTSLEEELKRLYAENSLLKKDLKEELHKTAKLEKDLEEEQQKAAGLNDSYEHLRTSLQELVGAPIEKWVQKEMASRLLVDDWVDVEPEDSLRHSHAPPAELTRPLSEGDEPGRAVAVNGVPVTEREEHRAAPEPEPEPEPEQEQEQAPGPKRLGEDRNVARDLQELRNLLDRLDVAAPDLLERVAVDLAETPPDITRL